MSGYEDFNLARFILETDTYTWMRRYSREGRYDRDVIESAQRRVVGQQGQVRIGTKIVRYRVVS